MEQMGSVDVVAFDKTGTLTLGEPRLTETVSLNGFGAATCCGWPPASSDSSEHPAGACDRRGRARRRSIEPRPCRTTSRRCPATACAARVDGRQVVIGDGMLAQAEIPLDPDALAQAQA